MHISWPTASITLKTQYHDMKQILNESTNELDYVEKFYNYVQMNFYLEILHKKINNKVSATINFTL